MSLHDELAEQLGDDEGGRDLEANWEHVAVGRLLSGLAVSPAVVRRQDTAHRLTLAAFCRAFPTFPIHLATRRVQHARRQILAALFEIRGGESVRHELSRTAVVTAFLEALEQAPDGGSVALLFPWRGIVPAVIHDAELRSADERQCLQVRARGRLFYLESLRSFVWSLPTDWCCSADDQ